MTGSNNAVPTLKLPLSLLNPNQLATKVQSFHTDSIITERIQRRFFSSYLALGDRFIKRVNNFFPDFAYMEDELFIKPAMLF